MNAGCRPTKPSPHIRDYSGPVKDYNGVGVWSEEGIKSRYEQQASRLDTVPAKLSSRRHLEGGYEWVYPLMDTIVTLIDGGDRAALEIGLDMMEEDNFFVFGKVIKSNTARALRRAALSEEQKERVRKRMVAMLIAGYVPQEFKQYRRLLRKVGMGSYWAALDAGVNQSNPYVMKIYGYLKSHSEQR